MTATLPSLPQASAATARQSGPLVPSSGALFGSHVDPDNTWVDFPDAVQEIDQFESEIGRTMDIDHHYMRWGWPLIWDFEWWDVQNGRTPMVSWEPWTASLDDIVAGRQDDYIRGEAKSVAAFGSPMFLRFGHEMNGNWYPWDGSHNNDPGTTNGSAKYVAAWRHIHDIFVQEGATNAVWVWCANAEDVPDEPWNHWTNYYPGDEYVDWVGMDGYNWGTSQSWSAWRSFSQTFSALYADYASRKPIMVSETASAELGGDKAAWITDARTALKTSFPDVAAFVWFDVDKETDWRVDSSPASLAAFQALANDAYFTPGSSSGGGDGTGEGSNPIAGVSASPHTMLHRTRISLRLSKLAKVSIRVVRTRTGHVARHIRHKVLWRQGRHRVPWLGRNDRLHPVRPGSYTIVVRAFHNGRVAVRKARVKIRPHR